MIRFILLSLSLMMTHQSIGMASEQLPDPTMPTYYHETRPTITTSVEDIDSPSISFDWVLNSTLISPYQKVAIINGQHLKLNEEIDGATIKRITHQQVDLDYQGQIITLSLHRSFISQIKKPSPL